MIELTPLLNKQLKTPLYIQLYEYIKKEIEAGGIPAGALLPPIRYLCEHLHLSKNTVESAYQQLTAEGYTESRPRIGIKVLPLEKTLMPPSQLKIHTNREQKDTGQASAATYDFKYGDIDLSHFPFKTWRRCLQNAMDSGDHDLFLYGDHKGDFGLRTELAKYLFQARGVRCVPEQIVICSGTQYAVGLLCQLLSMHGRLVARKIRDMMVCVPFSSTMDVNFSRLVSRQTGSICFSLLQAEPNSFILRHLISFRMEWSCRYRRG